jgi:hypothetical protein
MGKLHELIAVEEDVKKTFAKIGQETAVTFTKRGDHFDGTSRLYQAYNEADKDVPEQEVTHMVTSVNEKLAYTMPYLSKLLDIIYQKESANTIAKADLIVGDDEDQVTIAAGVPVLVLVQFENILTKFRQDVLDAIPTLDPKVDWERDESAGKGVWKTKSEVKTVRTKKIAKPVTLSPATDKFQAQVQLINEDIPVGEFIKTSVTGRLSPAQKSAILANIDLVIAGVKKARSRANDTAVETKIIGKKISDFISAPAGK